MASIKVVLRKKKNNEGLYPLAIRITENRKSSFISTGFYIDIVHWDQNARLVKKAHPNYKRVNRSLMNKIAEANDRYLDMEVKGSALSAGQISNGIKNAKEKVSFYDFSRKYIKNLYDSNRLSQLGAEKQRINRFINYTGRTDLLFSEIDELLLKQFGIYLKNELSLAEITVMNHLNVIRTIYNQAIKENVVDPKYYPFGRDKIFIKVPKTIKIGLNEEEVLKIESYKSTPGTGLHLSKNVWLFSFYFAGIRVSDVVRMKWSEIHDGRLTYSMGKNNKIVSLVIPKKAQIILDEYEKNKRSESDYVFPELKDANCNDPKDIYRKIRNANTKYNEHLKKIAKELKINKNLTMHIARHTFGNIAGDRIFPQMLQKLYRHSNLSTTIGYQGNFIHKDADEALNSVLDF
ncbi:MAG: site-specific integrase [Bacteroidales bacterium]|nr:site-specific integrase [Bacteroidales bacterium]MCF8458384.1 site-specific integrase [Bacteroidales bacterium]